MDIFVMMIPKVHIHKCLVVKTNKAFLGNTGCFTMVSSAVVNEA